MPPAESVRISPIAIKGVRVVWPRLLAVRSDWLAIVEGRDLLMTFALEATGPRIREVRALGYKPGSMALSASRHFLLLGNELGTWFEVRDAVSGESVTSVAGPDRFACTLATLDDMDVLVSATRAGVIEVLSLPDGDALARLRWQRPKPFVVDALRPLGDGQTLGLVAHPFLALTSSYLLTPLASLLSDTDALIGLMDGAVEQRPALDAAVGPCGTDEVLVYERPGWRGPTPAQVPGLSVRRLSDGGLVESVVCERGLNARCFLMGTPQVVALGVEGGVDVLPRKALGEAKPVFVPARATSFEPEAGRFAVATPDCRIEVYQLT